MNKIEHVKHTPISEGARKLLETLRDEVLPHIPEELFEMGHFVDDIKTYRTFLSQHPTDALKHASECGTSCCLAGWLSAHPDYLLPNGTGITSHLVVVLGPVEFDRLFIALFDTCYPDSLEQARKRIDYLLAHGYPDDEKSDYTYATAVEEVMPSEWLDSLESHDSFYN